MSLMYCVECGKEINTPKRKYCSETCRNNHISRKSYREFRDAYKSLTDAEREKFWLQELEKVKREVGFDG